MKKFFIAMLLITVIIVIYNEYPKSGSFNDLVLSQYPKKQFSQIEITKGNTHKNCDSSREINEFLEYLDKLWLTEYKRTVPCELDDIYNISIYDDQNNLLGITIENKEYIYVYVSVAGTQKGNYYKINKSNLNVKYIEAFYNKCKEEQL